MKQLVLIFPEVFLSAMALAVLLGEAFAPKQRKVWISIGIVSLTITGLHQLLFFVNGAIPGALSVGISPVPNPAGINSGWVQYAPVFGMITVDSLAVFFKLMTIASIILVLWLSTDYPEFQTLPMGTYVALLLLATVGMLFWVSSTDLLMALIALELLSICSFILTGFVTSRFSSKEGAIKFFLVGTFSTGILLFGISYYYGYFGTTQIDALLKVQASGQGADFMLSLILMFLVAGLGFKLAMVPFHMWAPDAYEGAPTPVTAFLSVAPKAAAVGFLIRLLGNHANLGITPVLAILAALTMTVGNVGAIQQTNVKRLLAYSSIAQIGYILVAIVAGGSLGSLAAMIYTFVYLFMNLGLFAGLLILTNENKIEDLPTFAGLYQKHFGLAFALVLFALSLTGLPPMSGFIGKFAIFSSLITHPDLIWLGVVAVINSVISLYYYFKIVHQMFFREAVSPAAPKLSPALVCCLVISLGVTVIVGLLPNQLLGWVRNLLGAGS